MKKSALTRKINEISKVLKSSKAKEALDALRVEVSSYIEAESETVGSTDFVVPKEVVDNPNKVALFTDGACRGNPGPGAWAYMIQNSSGDLMGEDSGVEKLTTNNKMELSAIIEGIRSFGRNSKQEIYVYTDSKYAVDGMKSWVAGWKKRGWKKADKKAPENLALWQELDQLNESLNLSFHWVKGHAGHPQNEYVDGLANKILDENGY